MNRDRFDTWTLDLMRADRPRSRRWAVAHVAGAALTGLVAATGFGPPAEAAACKKVDEPCRRPGQCCSGICGGKRRDKKCRGHGAGTCKRGQDGCTHPNPELLLCNNSSQCICRLTTSGTSFCGGVPGTSFCANCDRDADCVKLGYPAGSACIVTSRGRCSGSCKSGRACLVRCGVAPPPVRVSLARASRAWRAPGPSRMDVRRRPVAASPLSSAMSSIASLEVAKWTVVRLIT